MAYFRFVHKKAPEAIPTIAGVVLAPATDLEVPKIDFGSIAESTGSGPTEAIVKRLDIRDIFAPMDLPEADTGKGEQKKDTPVPTFTLGGTILGGDSPMAIINGKFIREGDEISGFKVLQIANNAVRLSNGKEEIELKVLKKQQKQ